MFVVINDQHQISEMSKTSNHLMMCNLSMFSGIFDEKISFNVYFQLNQQITWRHVK